MSGIITDVRVPATYLPVGRLLDGGVEARVEVEVECVIPIGDGLFPLFWVATTHASAVERALDADKTVVEFTRLREIDRRRLYSAIWNVDPGSLVELLTDHGVHVLRAEGSGDQWELRLQFVDREALVAFQRAAKDRGVAVEIVRLFSSELPEDPQTVSAAQREALVAALDRGYWEVPRRVTQSELADYLGVSDSSLSQRLRRGTRVAVSRLLDDESEPPR